MIPGEGVKNFLGSLGLIWRLAAGAESIPKLFINIINWVEYARETSGRFAINDNLLKFEKNMSKLLKEKKKNHTLA